MKPKTSSLSEQEILALHQKESARHRERGTGFGGSTHRLARMLAFAAAQRTKSAKQKSKRKAANASKRRNRGA